jgi:hypothetical protein
VLELSRHVSTKKNGRNLESNIAAVCLAADAVNVIVSNAEVSRFAAGRRYVVYVAVGMRDSKTPAFGHIWAIRAGNLMTHTVLVSAVVGHLVRAVSAEFKQALQEELGFFSPLVLAKPLST